MIRHCLDSKGNIKIIHFALKQMDLSFTFTCCLELGTGLSPYDRMCP